MNEIRAERSPDQAGCILAVNGGSSSLKFALYEAEQPLRLLRRGAVDLRSLAENDAVAAVNALLTMIEGSGAVAVVGHRIVHGGARHFDPQRVTAELLADLKKAVPFGPNHLPGELALIEALSKRLPGVPQIVCFDTAFHKDLPAVTRTLPLPRRFAEAGLRRYGFHGLSYTYLLEELGRCAGTEAANGRVILAHLGSGASLAAVRNGTSLDTTMGLTPAGGIVMGTRSGDLDPGVLVHLMRTESLTADQFDDLVNRESGLLGLSGTSADLRELLAREAGNAQAALAVAIFCDRVRKAIGAFAATLGGLDAIVFSGGIGEHSAVVRLRVCDGLGFLGIDLSLSDNAANAAIISSGVGSVVVRIIPTDEEIVIARSVHDLLRKTTS